MTKLFLDKAKEYFLYTFLFFVPIFYIPGLIDGRLVQERFFHVMAMLFISLFLGNIWITLFIWLNMLLFVIHGCEVGSSQVMSVFISSILFLISRNFFQDRSIMPYVRALYLVAALSMVWMVFQGFGIDPLNTQVTSNGIIMYDKRFDLMLGLLALSAFNGIFMCITASFMIFHSWIALLLIIPVLISTSSGAILGFGFLVAFWSYFKLRRLFIWIIASMLLAVGLYTFLDKKHDPLTYSSRFENWHLMIKQTLLMPLGYGPDSFRNYHRNKNFTFWSDEDYNPIIRIRQSNGKDIIKYYSADSGRSLERFKDRIPSHLSEWKEAHNEFIQFAFEYGILGVILLSFFCREIWMRFVLSNKDDETLALFACLAIYALVSTTQFPFHVARLSGFFGIILGAYWAKTDKSYLLFKGE